MEDEGLFDDEDEEETGALAMCVDLPSLCVCGCGTDVWNRGDFADMLGEDYLGLRELGIAAEFGMSSLSIPKRLLKGKKGKGVVAAYVLSFFLVFCVSSALRMVVFFFDPPSSLTLPNHLFELFTLIICYTLFASFIPPSLQPTFHLRETSTDRLRLACPFFTFDFSWPFSSFLFSALPAH